MTLTTSTAWLENRSNGTRTDIITHGLPLLAGELGPADLGTRLKVTGATAAADEEVQWRPVGRRYGPQDTGSYKYIEVSYPATLTATQEKQVTISQAVPTNPGSFALSANATSKIAAGAITFDVDGHFKTVNFSTIVQNANRIIDPGAHGCKARYRYRSRIGATAADQYFGFGFEVTLDLYSGLDYGNIYWKFYYGRCVQGQPQTGSGQLASNFYIDIATSATVTITGIDCYMMWETGFGSTGGSFKRFDNVSHASLNHSWTIHSPLTGTIPGRASSYTNRGKWPAKQLYRRKGRLFFGSVPSETNREMNCRGSAMTWKDRNCAPYRFLPDYPKYVASDADARTRVQAFRNKYEPLSDNDPIATTEFYSKVRSGAGSEAGVLGFGSQHCIIMLRSGHPGMLEVMEREAYQDSLRRGEFYDDNAQPVHIEDFPDAQVFNGDLYNGDGSQTNIFDSMGFNNYWTFRLPDHAPRNTDTGEVWEGLDHGHWCTIAQMHAALVGCDYLLLDQFETLHRNICVASNRIDAPTATSHYPLGSIPVPTTSRDWGRGEMLGVVTVYEVTGTKELIDTALIDRLRIVWDDPFGTYAQDRRYYGNPRHLPVIQTFPSTQSGFGVWDEGQGPHMNLTAPNPNHNSNGLLDKYSDAIWATAPAAVGAWAAYLLLDDYAGPTNARTNQALYIAADIANDIVTEGLFVNNAKDERRYYMLIIDQATVNPRTGSGTTAHTAFDFDNQALFMGMTMRGQISHAFGTVVRIGRDGGGADNGIGNYRAILKDCTGEFQQGETLEIVGSSPLITATFSFPTGLVLGAKAMAKNTTTGAFFTQAEIEETIVSHSVDFGPTAGNQNLYGAACLIDRNVFWYNPYGPLNSAGAAVAWACAQKGLYVSGSVDRNAEILVRATRVLKLLKDDADSYSGPTWDGDNVPSYYEYSSVVPITTGPEVPGIPTSPNNSNITQTSFTANWGPGFGVITQFNVEYRTGSVGPFAPAGSVPGTVFSLPIGGLSAATLYEWRVQAENGVGTSAFTAPLQVTTSSIVTPAPAAPTDPDTTNITTTSVTFTFRQADNLVERFETQYRVLLAPLWTTGPEVVPQFIGALIEQPFTGLTPNTDYEFQARARAGSQRSAFTASANAHTLAVALTPPGKPTGVVPSEFTTTSFRLSWVPADQREDNFTIHYRIGAGAWTDVPVPARTYTWAVTGRTPGTLYEVYVDATNGDGTSPASDSVDAQTLDALVAPTAPIIGGVRDLRSTSVIVFWTNTSATQTHVILRYTNGGTETIDPVPGGPTATEYAINGLQPETLYVVEIGAGNAAGDTISPDTFSFTTLSAIHIPLIPTIFGDIFDDI